MLAPLGETLSAEVAVSFSNRIVANPEVLYKGMSRDICLRPQCGRGYFRASSPPAALCATVP